MSRRTVSSPEAHRLRIGLTGLACVFLLVVLAASLFGLVGGEEATAPAPGDQLANAAQAPREPLAELGVAPGGAPEATTNSVQVLPVPGGS